MKFRQISYYFSVITTRRQQKSRAYPGCCGVKFPSLPYRAVGFPLHEEIHCTRKWSCVSLTPVGSDRPHVLPSGRNDIPLFAPDRSRTAGVILTRCRARRLLTVLSAAFLYCGKNGYCEQRVNYSPPAATASYLSAAYVPLMFRQRLAVSSSEHWLHPERSV